MASLRDEIGDFTGIPNDFMEDGDQTPESRLVFMFLRYHTNRKRKRAFPGYDLLMKESGLSRQKVAAGINALEKTGWLVKHKKFAQNTEYELRYPATALSSTMERRQEPPLVPPENSISSTVEQPPYRENKIEVNKIKETRAQEKPLQPDSDDEHDAKAPKYSIAEMEHPPPEMLAAIESVITTGFPDVPFGKFYRKWWRNRHGKGGIGRHKGDKSTIRQYVVNIEGYFETVHEGGTNGNGANNGQQQSGFESTSERNVRFIRESLARSPSSSDEDNNQESSLLLTAGTKSR